MMESTMHPAGMRLERLGMNVTRYGLAAVLLWVGALKFTAYEDEAVSKLCMTNPLLSWGPQALGTYGFPKLLGVIEIVLGLLIASRAAQPRWSALGSLGAVIMLAITLTLLLSTPGVWQMGYGFPFLSAMPGQFLAKDLLFLGAALWTAGEAQRAAALSMR